MIIVYTVIDVFRAEEGEEDESDWWVNTDFGDCDCGDDDDHHG